MITVEGGTHLGIVGCYGERDFVDEDAVRRWAEDNYPEWVCWSYDNVLENKRGDTLFEYRIVPKENIPLA